jgi:hypothetical protein
VRDINEDIATANCSIKPQNSMHKVPNFKIKHGHL